MIIHKMDIKIGSSNRIAIYQDSDTHLKSEGHDKHLHSRFRRKIEQDPDAYWIHTGDMTDDDRPSTRERRNLMYHDRAEALTQEDKEHQEYLDRHVIPLYQPIASKCLGLIAGDHFRIYKTGMNSTEYIARALKVPYLGERMGYVSIIFRKGEKSMRYDLLARHGKAASSTPGGDMNALMRQNARWEADLLLGGHTHQENAHPEPICGVNQHRDNLYQKIRWYIRGGSFLRGFVVGRNKEHYAEKEEYSPLCIGWGRVDLFFGQPHSNGDNLCITNSEGVLSVS